MNLYILYLYQYNKFIPNLFIGFKTFFYQIIHSNQVIRNWEDILSILSLLNEEQTIIYGNKELYFYVNVLCNKYSFNNFNNYFETELNNYKNNCENYISSNSLNNVYLYQEIKQYLLNLNDILLFIDTYNHIYGYNFDELNIEYYFDNITEHIEYILLIGNQLFSVLLHHLYDFYNFQLQSDLNEMRMYQYPILNVNNIKSRNIVLKEHLSIDFLFNLYLENEMKIQKQCSYFVFKENIKKLSKIIDKCIDIIYLNGKLDKSYNILINSDINTNINTNINKISKNNVIVSDINLKLPIVNIVKTPKKSDIELLKIMRNKLSSVKKYKNNNQRNDIQSPYHKSLQMKINNIDLDILQGPFGLNNLNENVRKSARKLIY
jgi:hypothetical protein